MSPDVHTLTGAYALDALDPDERAIFERHLAECADCAAEVVEFRAAAARLGVAVALSPPERLRARIRAGIARTRQQRPNGFRLARRNHADDSVTGSGWLLPTTAVAAGLAVLAAGLLAGIAIHAEHRVQDAQEQLNAVQQRNAPMSQLLAAPDVRIVSVDGTAGSATLLDSHTLDKGLLITRNLPDQPAGKTYQAWDIGPTGFQSLGLLGNTRSSSLSIPDLASSDDIGITVEPVGGSDQPTSAPIMDFAVSHR